MRIFICILLLAGSCELGNAQNLYLEPKRSEDEFVLMAYNELPCPISLQAKAADIDTTFEVFIPRKRERALIRWPDPADSLFSNPRETFTYDYVVGNPYAAPDDDYAYSLPFPEGEAYTLTQGNKSDFTHNEPISRYAFDFAMPVGSYVSAARGGTVGVVVEEFKIGGQDRKLMKKSNRIMVCHNDGTVAVYAHLQHKGALVEVGDKVFVGQVIGLSGNTGYTTSPHLHFTVLAGRKSIPIRFRNQYTILYEGEVYKNE